MISEKMVQAINEQIKRELESSYLYLAMAAYFHSEGYDGMAKWMKAQAKEELGHAMKFFGHLQERDGRIELHQIDKPKKDWKSPLDAFREAYEHEKYITSEIHKLVELAEQEKDYAASILLQWFVTEQVEEEASTSQVVQWFERMGDTGHGLVMLDVQLGKRE